MAQVPCKPHKSGNVVSYTAAAAVSIGDVIVQGNLVGIANHDAATGETVALDVTGVFTVPKDNSNLSSVGRPVYWDADGDPVGGEPGSGAFTATATGNTFAGWNLEIAGAEAGSVRILLRSANDADTMGTDNLSDVGTVTHTSGSILVADGSKYEEVAVSGDVTLASTGAVTLNAAHAEQTAYIPVTALTADSDLSSTLLWAHPRACTLVSIGYLSAGDYGTVTNDSTSVFAVTDGADNAIVSKTYNTATQPSTTAINDFGSLDETNKSLTAGEGIKLAITNGSTAKTPAGVLVVRYIPTNA